MFRTLILSTAVLVPVAAVAAMAMPASTYVKKAGASDLYEIRSSKLVMDSANPKLRDFAATMVKDHTESTDDVKAAAMKAGLKPAPPMLDPAQSAMIAKLTHATGAARDRLYVEQQKTAHQQALALQEGYAASGATPSLRMAATKIVPVVKGHIHMLATM